MELQAVIQTVFNNSITAPRLNTVTMNKTAVPPTLNTKGGEDQGILTACFDSANNRLRVVPV